MVKSLSFSGHRLDKLESILDGYNVTMATKLKFIEDIKSVLYVKVNSYIDGGFRRFYIGMSDGIDLWAGQILLELKSCQYPDIEIVAVQPYRNHGRKFSLEDRLLYNELLNNASSVVCLSDKSSKWCYLYRDEYMVKNSTNLLAFASDLNSGTGYTIKYAKSLNRFVELVDLTKLRDSYLANL
jgi:uncharacterized phage-like protein YoqJ